LAAGSHTKSSNPHEFSSETSSNTGMYDGALQPSIFRAKIFSRQELLERGQ
jgi:hypothetical protein